MRWFQLVAETHTLPQYLNNTWEDLTSFGAKLKQGLLDNSSQKTSPDGLFGGCIRGNDAPATQGSRGWTRRPLKVPTCKIVWCNSLKYLYRCPTSSMFSAETPSLRFNSHLSPLTFSPEKANVHPYPSPSHRTQFVQIRGHEKLTSFSTCARENGESRGNTCSSRLGGQKVPMPLLREFLCSPFRMRWWKVPNV